MKQYLLAIDQGTTSSRAIVFDERGRRISAGQQEFAQHYPQNGWVEHDPEDIWRSTLAVCREALAGSGLAAKQIAGIGITNQRETTVVWERDTGKPIYHAIVWQDRRTASVCEGLRAAGHEPYVQAKTGLLLDPYFSATKIAWILDHVPGARARAERGELAFGTIDSFLLWRLTGGASHLTDASNASRTLLFDIHLGQWDDELLSLLRVPRAMLPDVRDCASHFGSTLPALLGGVIPICGIAGDQQAALIGQGCFVPGMVKSTYGTGCFLVMNTGDKPVASKNRLLTTIAWRLGGKTTYALEGSIFMAGATMQWLRDGLHLFTRASETEALARAAGDSDGVYLVPAFAGLGAPYWDPHARGAILGLTRDTGIGQIVTAGLQAVCYQTADLMAAMVSDGAQPPRVLRVDGGMVANDWLVQFLADMLDVEVARPAVTETTALGAACLAGLQAGLFASLDEIGGLWQCERSFMPQMDAARRQALYAGWVDAVGRVRGSAGP